MPLPYYNLPETVITGTGVPGTDTVTGPGTTGPIAKFTSSGAVGDSLLTESGTTISLGGTLVVSGGTVTASTPILNLTQTWNQGGTTFFGIKLNVTDSASSSVSEFAEFQVGGVQKIGLYKSGSAVFQGNVTAFAGSLTLGNTVMLQETANILAIRNGANAQTWNVYATYTSGSDYRRLRTTMTTGGAATIAAEGLGGGATGNQLIFSQNGSQVLGFSLTGNAAFAQSISILSTGSFSWSGRNAILAPSDSQYVFANNSGTDVDIFLKLGINNSAAAGIKRVGTALQIRLNDDSAFAGIQPLSVHVPSSNGIFAWTSSSYLSAPSDGIIRLNNNAGTGFTRLNFGGDTSSFPALRRTSTNVEAVLADNSDWAGFQSRYHRISSGSPEGVVTAPVGALFSRTDGGAGTTLYVKESGSGNTGWVAK